MRHNYEAELAISAALQLAPTDTDYLAFLASIYVQQHLWQEALDAAQQGLNHEPNNLDCLNILAFTLARRQQYQAAEVVARQAIAQNPESAESHGLLGLVLLLQTSGYDSTHVLPHFRAALRLNPQLDFARYGVAEVLKSRFLPYRLLVRWGHILAIGIITLLGVCLVGLSGETGIPEIILLVSLSLLVIIPSLANVMLRFHPLGRFALAPEQVWGATWIGSSLVGLLVSTVLYFATKNIGWIASAVVCGILILLVAEVEVISFPRFQKWMQRLTIALATSGFLGSLGLIMLDATKQGADFIHSTSRLPEPLCNLFAVCMLAGFAIALLLFAIGLPVARAATAIPESIEDWQRYCRGFKRWRGQSKRS